MRRMLQVYLAGPITGCSYGNAVSWREWVKDELKEEFICLSPMRAKDYLVEVNDISKSYESDRHDALPRIGEILSCNKGINRRDSWDCRTADLVLMNLADLSENKEVRIAQRALRSLTLSPELRRLGKLADDLEKCAKRVTIGTILELGMAWMHRKPVVCVMPNSNIHEHPMVEDMIDFRCPSLDIALEVLRALR